MSEQKAPCVDPARGPIGHQQAALSDSELQKEVPRMVARVGKPAPDFEANAFVEGGFKKIKLSDYIGQWVMLCFYPGDFTFV